MQSNFKELPYLQKIVGKYPVESFDGMPALTDDLMWKSDVPLFMTGKFAALRLGPGAANLEGARLGAERIVWGLEDVLNKENIGGRGDGDADADSDDDEGMRREIRYGSGIGSRFESLEVEV